jgi:hypothetical protein
MSPGSFEERRAAEWVELERLIAGVERKRPEPGVEELPRRFREACADLALARHRMYPAQLVERLNALVIRGYKLLYRSRRGGAAAFVEFVAAGFPQALRAEWRLFWLCSALFWLPFLAMLGSAWLDIDWIRAALGPEGMAGMESMYGGKEDQIRHFREAYGSNFMMFAHYIENNVGIDFQIFAGGIVAGLGTSATIAMHLAVIDTARIAAVASLAGGPVDQQGTRTVRIALALAPLLQTRLGLALGRRKFSAAVREQSADPAWFTPEVADAYLAPLEKDVRGQLTVLKDMHDAKEPTPIASRLSQIVAPMRLLLGDKPTPNAPSREQVQLLMHQVRRLTIDTVHRAGTLMHEERPADVVRVLDDMLKGVRRTRPQVDPDQLLLDLRS